MAKQCIFLDYTVHVFLENVDCSSGQTESGNAIICSPRNIRLIAVGDNDDPDNGILGDPQRVTLSSTHLVHVIFDAECIPSGCICLTITRAIECGNGCAPGYYSVPVPFHGSGMMLPPGEYTISIQDQCAYGAFEDNLDKDYPLSLLFEPVSRDIVDAALFNNACGR